MFGYFIEVSNSYKNLVPETYIRKQTLTSGERYITQELKELESKILGAHERLISLERRLFDELLESIGAQLDRIQRTANAIAQLDVLAALAQVAAENNYCRPVVDDSVCADHHRGASPGGGAGAQGQYVRAQRYHPQLHHRPLPDHHRPQHGG